MKSKDLVLFDSRALDFIRDDISPDKYQLWLHENSEKLLSLGIPLIKDLLCKYFSQQDEVEEIKVEIKNYFLLNANLCKDYFWKKNEKVLMVGDNYNILENFKLLAIKTPWLQLLECENCKQLWFVAIDTVDDDFYFQCCKENEKSAILENEIWPIHFAEKKEKCKYYQGL